MKRWGLFFLIAVMFPPILASNGTEKIEFSGIRRTDKNSLQAIVEKYSGSKAKGSAWADPLLREIRKLPMIKEAYIVRDLVGKTTIQVVERRPIGYLVAKDHYWIDDSCEVIDKISLDHAESMIFFSGPWKNKTEFDKKSGQRILCEGVKLFSDLIQQKFPENEISELHFDAKQGWIMYRVGRRSPVVFGHQNLNEKVGRWMQIVPQLQNIEGSIRRIDADFDDRIVVKLIGPQSLEASKGLPDSK